MPFQINSISMNGEEDPHRHEPAGGNREGAPSQDPAARALEQAKEGLHKGVAEFRRLDRLGQVYLGGLAVVVVFGLVFNHLGFSAEAREVYEQAVGYSTGRSTLAGAGKAGLLMLLASLAGMGIYIWNLRSAVKPSWVPKALAGCAGGVLLMILLATREGSGLPEAKASRTLLGFWLPLLGAAAAIWASVKPILDARPRTPVSPPRKSPPRPPAAG